MGYYLETPSAKGKADWLIANAGAVETVPVFNYGDHLTVFVAENGVFDAAAVAYSKKEYDRFMDSPKWGDDRKTRYLKVSTAYVLAKLPMLKDLVNPEL